MKNMWRMAAAALAAAMTFFLVGFSFSSVESPNTVKGAIVNLDEGVEIDGQWVPMGRQLAAEMVLQESVFDWEMSTAQIASESLTDGTYMAVVTIPEDFSESVTSLASGSKVVQAKVDVQMRPGSDFDQKMAVELVTRAASVALGGQIADEFVVTLVDGFTELGTGLEEVSNGATKLAAGMGELSVGVQKLDEGATQLDGGMNKAASSFGELEGGVTELGAGAGLAAGGVSQYVSGSDQMVKGVGKLSQGASQVVLGAEKLVAGTTQLAEQGGQYVGGVTQLAEGVVELVAQVQNILVVFQGLEGIISQYYGAPEFVQEMVGMVVVMNSVGAMCSADPSQQLCQGIAAAYPAVNFEKYRTITVEQLMGTIVAPIKQAIRDMMSDPSMPTEKDLENLQLLADGAKALAASGTQLSAGMKESAAGTKQFADGVNELVSGLNLASTKANALVAGGHAVTGGVDKLTQGIGQLKTGVNKASGGLNQLSTGTHDLSTGTTELNSGVEELGIGGRDLANGMETVVEQIPTYSEGEAKDMAVGISQPIEPPNATIGVSARGASAVALLLWIVSFLLVSIYPVFPNEISRSVKPSWRLAARVWWKPALWMALIGASIGFAFGNWIDIDVGTKVVLASLGSLVGIVFASVQQALVASLGAVGRATSLAMFVVASTSAATTGWGTPLDSIAEFLPTGIAQDTLNAVAIPAMGTTLFSLVGLGAWALGAYAMATWATANRRSKPVGKMLATL